MKLLFDENLPPRLCELLARDFPGSRHVRDCGLRGMPDQDVWEHARIHGFTLVSKDSDFQQRVMLEGAPPKLIWLRIGNCTTSDLANLISSHQSDIHALDQNPLEAILVLA